MAVGAAFGAYSHVGCLLFPMQTFTIAIDLREHRAIKYSGATQLIQSASLLGRAVQLLFCKLVEGSFIELRKLGRISVVSC